MQNVWNFKKMLKTNTKNCWLLDWLWFRLANQNLIFTTGKETHCYLWLKVMFLSTVHTLSFVSEVDGESAGVSQEQIKEIELTVKIKRQKTNTHENTISTCPFWCDWRNKKSTTGIISPRWNFDQEKKSSMFVGVALYENIFWLISSILLTLLALFSFNNTNIRFLRILQRTSIYSLKFDVLLLTATFFQHEL